MVPKSDFSRSDGVVIKLAYHSGKAITWNYYPEISYIPKNNDRFCHLRWYQKVKILGWAHGLFGPHLHQVDDST